MHNDSPKVKFVAGDWLQSFWEQFSRICTHVDCSSGQRQESLQKPIEVKITARRFEFESSTITLQVNRPPG
jgi:hypothetical protein